MHQVLHFFVSARAANDGTQTIFYVSRVSSACCLCSAVDCYSRGSFHCPNARVTKSRTPVRDLSPAPEHQLYIGPEEQVPSLFGEALGSLLLSHWFLFSSAAKAPSSTFLTHNIGFVLKVAVLPK